MSLPFFAEVTKGEDETVFKEKYFSVAHGETACGRVPTKLFKCFFGCAHELQNVCCTAASHRPFQPQVPLSTPEEHGPLKFIGDSARDKAKKRGSPLGVPERDDTP